MTRITVNPDTQTQRARLKGVAHPIEICDADGQTLGYFHPAPAIRLADLSPHSDEELAELRKQKTGRPLADILRDLEEKYPA